MQIINKNKITVLPDFIANQIAAGEVVQKPESVVKELVENSLDAGTTSIAVIIHGAGKQLIHIVDNGCGISYNDIPLSIKRHATSKILTQDDLEMIHSYGFRGEALASISSVAQLEIRTRTKDDLEHGWRLISDPGQDGTVEPFNTDFGTQIFVRNLFYNVPARRKFLRSDLTEFRYISDTMIKFAISRPDIRFTFYDSDTLIIDVQPATLEKRIADILGENTANSLIPINFNSQSINLYGFVGLPHLAKQSRSEQFLFLNGRSINSRSLSFAVFSAYEHLLEKNANPTFVVNLEIDPQNIDINVHPQKHEVKFDDERFVFSCINKAVMQALANNNLIPEIKLVENNSKNPFEKLEFSTPSKQDNYMLVNKMTGEVIDNKPNYPNYQKSNYTGNNNYSNQSYSNNFNSNYTNPNSQRNQEQITNKELSAFEAIFGKNDNKIETEHLFLPSEKPDSMFWQLHNKYILSQTETGFIIFDQHAAHERILYEKAISTIEKQSSTSQELLFPVNIWLDASQIAILQELKQEFYYLGFNFDIITNNDVVIKGVPVDVPSGYEENSIKEIIELYQEYDKIYNTSKRDNLAASFSCKAAIKTGQPLSQEEMKNLLSMLMICKVPNVCPHGRPVIIEFLLSDLDKRFFRIL